MKATFEALSLPDPDGTFYLRPDRILGCFLLDPDVPLLGDVTSELAAEVEKDVATRVYLEEVRFVMSVIIFPFIQS
jgi:hypothetical protein